MLWYRLHLTLDLTHSSTTVWRVNGELKLTVEPMINNIMISIRERPVT